MSEHAFRICYPIIVSFLNEDEFALGLGRVNKMLFDKKKYCTNIQPHGEVVDNRRTRVLYSRQGRLLKVTYYNNFSSMRIHCINEYIPTDTNRQKTTHYHANGNIESISRFRLDCKCRGLHERWNSIADNSLPCTGGTIYVEENTSWYSSGKLESITRYEHDNGRDAKFVGRQEYWHGNGQLSAVRIYGTTPEEAGVLKERVRYNQRGEVTFRTLPADGSASSIII
jgi:antitoxin component YwqK of YwqJK toxin-antitoxin module